MLAKLKIFMYNLKKIKEDTESNIVILADNNGAVIDSLNTEFDSNFAMMTEAAFSMCSDLLKDVINKDMDQLMAKSSDGFFIANRLDKESILLIVSDNLSKLGLLLKYMSSIKNN